MSEIVKMEFKGTRGIFERFKLKYPQLMRRGISYEPDDAQSIKIYIPGVGKLIYELYGDTITWLEHWVDEQEIKEHEKERRPKMYIYFCFVIDEYMRNNKLTQQQFADLVGISRRSLIKYLNGDAVPKVSTMQQICESINIQL